MNNNVNEQVFFNACNNMLKETLRLNKVRIFDVKKNSVLSEKDMNYSKVLFDSDLNIYKITDSGIEKVNNENFKAVII